MISLQKVNSNIEDSTITQIISFILSITMDSLPKSYKKLSKKQLIRELLRQMNDNIFIVSENHSLNKNLMIKNNVIKSKDLRIEDQQKIIVKYKELLEISVENL